MTEYLGGFEMARQCDEKLDAPVHFENGDMFLLKYDKEKEICSFGAEPLPFTSFRFRNLVITDEKLLCDLKKAPKIDVILEAENSILGGSVKDPKYDRPADPPLCVIAEARSGMLLKCEMLEPEEDVVTAHAEELVGFILLYGAPKEIRISNVIVEAGLEQICKSCGTKPKRVKRLNNLDVFLEGFRRSGR